MSVFTTARQQLADKLVAAGADATVDPGSLPPFVLVDLVSITNNAGIGGWRGTVPVKLVAAPPGDLTAGLWLEEQLELVLRTLGYAPASPGTYTAGDKACPSYTLTYPIDINNPDC